jgi:hypothetical protein
MMHDFPAWKRFGKDVYSYVIGRAIGQQDFSVLNGAADEMVADVNVLGPCVVVVGKSQTDGSLVVTK